MQYERMICAAAVLTLVLTGGACGEEHDDDDGHEENTHPVTSADCESGLRWAGGDEESPNMRPGGDCNECHLREREGPVFGAAGTVFTSFDAADDCYGVEGIIVEITDAKGKVHTATTHPSGNFYLDDPIETPYTAVVVGTDGSERPMVAEQTITDCNRCHTERGTNMAPGRIIAP